MERLRQGLAAAVFLALGAGSAGAIEVYRLDGSGGWGPVPVSVTWALRDGGPSGGTRLADVSAGAGTSWEVLLGVPSLGALEYDSQERGIYGAGAVLPAAPGYRVEFRFDGYTWDSYSLFADEGARGYWDLFALNLNQAAPYWDLVAPAGGDVALRDPLVTIQEEGRPVVSAGPLPGMTWGWGGRDYEEGDFEELHGAEFWVELSGDPLLPYYLSAVLDTDTEEYADDVYPSYGGFGAQGATESLVPAPTPTPEPSTLVLLGTGVAACAAWRRRRWSGPT